LKRAQPVSAASTTRIYDLQIFKVSRMHSVQ
jgi:hypothetical protein